MLKAKHGFTLIELLVVIAIIGILSAVIIASLNTARAKARDARKMEDMHQIELALNLYYAVNGQYPGMFGGAGSAFCSTLDAAPAGWLSPYISAVPKDPLDAGAMPYMYEYCEQHPSGSYDTQTYTVWTSLETSSGNADSALWGPLSGAGYRPPNYNYVVANWHP
jgi:type II secretion system protein G